MPNGYTADIYDGDDSLKNYAVRVAKSFGAYYHLRDESGDASLSKIDDGDILYYRKKIDESQTAYDEFTALSREEQEALWQEDLAKIREANAKSLTRNTELAQRYATMLGKVVAWNVPNELSGLKETMKKYLIESMDFDCGVGPVYQFPEPTFDKWLDDKVASMTRDIRYYSKGLAQEEKRVAEQHAWHEMFMNAIKDVD